MRRRSGGDGNDSNSFVLQEEFLHFLEEFEFRVFLQLIDMRHMAVEEIREDLLLRRRRFHGSFGVTMLRLLLLMVLLL